MLESMYEELASAEVQVRIDQPVEKSEVPDHVQNLGKITDLLRGNQRKSESILHSLKT